MHRGARHAHSLKVIEVDDHVYDSAIAQGRPSINTPRSRAGAAGVGFSYRALKTTLLPGGAYM